MIFIMIFGNFWWIGWFSTSAPLSALVLLVASDVVSMYVCMSPCSWATQEQLQSAITMASVNRIDSIFFVWLRVCLLYVGDNMPRAPHARAVLWRHVQKLALRNFSKSRATLKSNYYGFRTLNWLKFCLCGTMCAFGFYNPRAPCARGNVHMPFYDSMCLKNIKT